MISIKMIGKGTCDNCKRTMPIRLERKILGNEYRLCEDCSNAIARLHYLCMEQGESYKYDKDDFIKLGGK